MHVNYTVLSVRRTADTRTQVQMRSHSNNTQLWKRAYHHSCLTQHPATHSPSPFCVLHPLCVVLFSVDGSTKGGRLQISTKWQINTRPTDSNLDLSFVTLHIVTAYKCPQYPYQHTITSTLLPLVSHSRRWSPKWYVYVCMRMCLCVVGVCPIFLVFF